MVQAGQTQSLYLVPEAYNTYVASTPTTTAASGELFLGLQLPVKTSYFVQFGVAAGINSRLSLQGNIWQLGEPDFNNFTYQYSLQHSQVLFKMRFLSSRFSHGFLPYLGAGIGAAFNRAYDFSMTPLAYEIVPEAPFQSNTKASFAYTVSAGFMLVLSTHWQLGLGYEFANEGQSQLGPSVMQTTDQTISLSHLYTNQLQFTLSYLSLGV